MQRQHLEEQPKALHKHVRILIFDARLRNAIAIVDQAINCTRDRFGSDRRLSQAVIKMSVRSRRMKGATWPSRSPRKRRLRHSHRSPSIFSPSGDVDHANRVSSSSLAEVDQFGSQDLVAGACWAPGALSVIACGGEQPAKLPQQIARGFHDCFGYPFADLIHHGIDHAIEVGVGSVAVRFRNAVVVLYWATSSAPFIWNNRAFDTVVCVVVTICSVPGTSTSRISCLTLRLCRFGRLRRVCSRRNGRRSRASSVAFSRMVGLPSFNQLASLVAPETLWRGRHVRHPGRINARQRAIPDVRV